MGPMNNKGSNQGAFAKIESWVQNVITGHSLDPEGYAVPLSLENVCCAVEFNIRDKVH